MDVDDVWCRTNNQTSQEMFLNVPRVVHACAPSLRCASALSTCTAFISERVFLGGLRHHRSSGCTQEGTLLSPSAQVVCYSCWLWKLLVFLFFKAQTCFSVQHRPAWAHSRFIGLWNAQRCLCTQLPRFDHLHDPRQYAMPCSSVRLRCLQCVWGGQILLVNSVVIYFDCHPICQFSFGNPNAPGDPQAKSYTWNSKVTGSGFMQPKCTSQRPRSAHQTPGWARSTCTVPHTYVDFKGVGEIIACMLTGAWHTRLGSPSSEINTLTNTKQANTKPAKHMFFSQSVFPLMAIYFKVAQVNCCVTVALQK